MKISIITAFPQAFSFLDFSIPKRAQEKKLLQLEIVDLRKFGLDERKTIDDRPYGGGAGMVLMIEPIYLALKSVGVYPERDEKTKIILMSAKGKNWNQNLVEEYKSNLEHIVIICGHYEGVDERVVENLIDEEISIGDYILSGGELGAMIIVDTITRLIPGVLGKEESFQNETRFENGKKIPEHPHYTRPEKFITTEGEEWKVPDILLSGHHKNIEEWRKTP